MITKRFIKIDEASELTRLKPKTIREYCSRRLIPHIKLRGAVLFDTEDLEAWLEDSKVKPIRQLLLASTLNNYTTLKIIKVS